jgi:ABC-2 type transport system permease protein
VSESAVSAIRSRPTSSVSDALTMVVRSVRLSTRNVDAVLTSVILPVVIMLLFVYLFGGAIETGAQQYVDYVVPGVLLLCTGFVAAMTAVGVTDDLRAGIIDRFRSMDVSGAAILTGHVAASVVRTATATVAVAIAVLIGFRPTATPLRWLAASGMLLLFVLAVSWLSAVFGLLARTPEGAGGFSFVVMFLPYPSSAFVPVDTMPSWLQAFAEHQPATPVIETLRGLLMGTPPIGNSAGLAVVWCAGIVLVSIASAGVLFHRRTT